MSIKKKIEQILKKKGYVSATVEFEQAKQHGQNEWHIEMPKSDMEFVLSQADDYFSKFDFYQCSDIKSYRISSNKEDIFEVCEFLPIKEQGK